MSKFDTLVIQVASCCFLNIRHWVDITQMHLIKWFVKMDEQNFSIQFTEQRSEKAGGKRFIKLDFIYRNNHHHTYTHWTKCYISDFVFLHNDLLHIIPHNLSRSPLNHFYLGCTVGSWVQLVNITGILQSYCHYQMPKTNNTSLVSLH